MRRKTSLNKAIDEPAVNLTPLIDVVFVILIMFIVIAPLLELDKVELADAAAADLKTSSTSVQENSPISIHVLKDNTIRFNKQVVNAEQLIKLLRDSKTRYPNARPQLFHDKSAHFGTYQSVKNAAEIAGFTQLDVVLKPS
jgi:biopolymer transport protein ExbD